MMNEQQFKSLSVEQRKAIQKNLQAAGHYTGAIDGTWGATTESALKLEEKATDAEKAKQEAREEKARTDKLEELRLTNQRIAAKAEADQKAEETRQSGESKKITDAAALAKHLRKQKYTEQEMSPEGMAAQSSATLAAPAAAGWAGLRFGDKVNQAMDRGQEKRNLTLQGAAADRVKGLTTREGAVTGARLAGAMPPSNAAVRVLGRAAPHAALAAIAAAKGGSLLGDVDEEQPFYPRMADRGAGLAYLGFGGGILKRGIQQAQSPGVSPDAQALSVINSTQLRRNNQAPEDTGPKVTPRQALVAEAKAAGITGTGKMNMDALKKALTKVGSKTPLIGPAVAGALAYGMTPDSAEAATGGTVGGTGEALTNAGVASGTAAGTSYGLGRLSKALGGAGRAALSGAGSMLTPMGAADATDTDPALLAQDQNLAARTLPAWLRAGKIEDAYQMAQVPERAPAGGDGFGQARALDIPEGIPLPQPGGGAEFDSARSLDIPEGIPLPQESGELPPELAQLEQAAAQDPELAALLQELIMARVGDAPAPTQNAMASQAVAAQQPSRLSAALRNISQR